MSKYKVWVNGWPVVQTGRTLHPDPRAKVPVLVGLSELQVIQQCEAIERPLSGMRQVTYQEVTA